METSALFQVGTKDPLLTTVGVPYGYLVVEGYQPVEVLHLAAGRDALKEAAGREIINGDQAGTLEAEMVAAGLLPDEAALHQTVAGFKIPADYKPGYSFEVCGECALNFPGLPHGNIVDDEDGDLVTGKIGTLAEGFTSCRNAAKGDKVNVLDAISVFQQMIAANLSANDDDVKARYKALPEKTRAKLESEGRAGQASIVEIPGLGRMVALEIPLPRGLFEGLFGGKPAAGSEDNRANTGKEGRRQR